MGPYQEDPMNRTQTLAAILAAFAAGYFMSAQPAKADVGAKCTTLTVGASKAKAAEHLEASLRTLQAGGRTNGVATTAFVVCAW